MTSSFTACYHSPPGAFAERANAIAFDPDVQLAYRFGSHRCRAPYRGEIKTPSNDSYLFPLSFIFSVPKSPPRWPAQGPRLFLGRPGWLQANVGVASMRTARSAPIMPSRKR
jgi:hypothetical protein